MVNIIDDNLIDEETSIEDEYKENVISVVRPTNSDALNAESKDIISQIIAEKDPDKFKDLTSLFELNQRKKNMARINRLSNLLEMVDDEVILRVSTSPEDIENRDLIGYMNAAQKSMTAIEQSFNQTPLIQVNNQSNEIHISNESGLNRESRKKVLDAVMSIIENAQNTDNIIEVEGEEIDD